MLQILPFLYGSGTVVVVAMVVRESGDGWKPEQRFDTNKSPLRCKEATCPSRILMDLNLLVR